jgi:hypothetical protein
MEKALLNITHPEKAVHESDGNGDNKTFYNC